VSKKWQNRLYRLAADAVKVLAVVLGAVTGGIGSVVIAGLMFAAGQGMNVIFTQSPNMELDKAAQEYERAHGVKIRVPPEVKEILAGLFAPRHGGSDEFLDKDWPGLRDRLMNASFDDLDAILEENRNGAFRKPNPMMDLSLPVLQRVAAFNVKTADPYLMSDNTARTLAVQLACDEVHDHKMGVLLDALAKARNKMDEDARTVVPLTPVPVEVIPGPVGEEPVVVGPPLVVHSDGGPTEGKIVTSITVKQSPTVIGSYISDVELGYRTVL
jgi:hypothetical protein